MEFVKVTYPTDRFIYIDDEQDGRTNSVLRVEAGTHVFDLGTPANYRPASRQVEVKDTTILQPMLIAFTRKGK